MTSVPTIATQHRILRALSLRSTDCTPVWFMRQAGRSLPEYRAIKEHYSLLEICRQPELCAEVTLQPVRRLGVDAAILYADIMHPLVGIGVDLEIKEGVGPVIAHPIRTLDDLSTLRPLEPAEDLPFVTEAIHCVLDRLDDAVPLIGFSGAPFTLASYLIEGRPSRDFRQTKLLMYTQPDVWRALMQRLSSLVVQYLRMQAEAGVHVLQLFDSWVGALSASDYSRYVQPYSTSIFAALADLGLPTIHFGTNTATFLEAMRDAGGTTIGVDWRIALDDAWQRLGWDRGIQGNIDPLVLQAPWEVVKREAGAILEHAAGRPGHVFNVGHGIHPATDPDGLARLVDFVHETSARAAA